MTVIKDPRQTLSDPSSPSIARRQVLDSIPRAKVPVHRQHDRLNRDSHGLQNNGAETSNINIPASIQNKKSYKGQSLYESGSRFNLPKVNPISQDQICRIFTVVQLAQVVDAYNLDLEDLSPGAILTKFALGKQNAPDGLLTDKIRQSLNVTPTKPRAVSGRVAAPLPKIPVVTMDSFTPSPTKPRVIKSDIPTPTTKPRVVSSNNITLPVSTQGHLNSIRKEIAGAKTSIARSRVKPAPKSPSQRPAKRQKTSGAFKAIASYVEDSQTVRKEPRSTPPQAILSKAHRTRPARGASKSIAQQAEESVSIPRIEPVSIPKANPEVHKTPQPSTAAGAVVEDSLTAEQNEVKSTPKSRPSKPLKTPRSRVISQPIAKVAPKSTSPEQQEPTFTPEARPLKASKEPQPTSTTKAIEKDSRPAAPKLSKPKTTRKTPAHTRTPSKPKTPPTRRISTIAPSEVASEPDYDVPVPGSTKRKPSAGSQAYTPDQSALKKKLRDAKRVKVEVLDEPLQLEVDEEDPSFQAEPVKKVRTRSSMRKRGRRD